MDAVRMLPAGEQGLVVEFGKEIDPAVNARVCRLARILSARRVPGILETVPTYRSLLVVFDPLILPRERLVASVEDVLAGPVPEDRIGGPGKVVDLPVCYGGEFGPDLEFVARHNHLAVGEVIAIHSGVFYLVYMLGFTPGFPYLGGMPGRIAAPRLSTPRGKVPAGSVGIAGDQTGVYPIESPGGWRLVGRTPVRLFDPHADEPFLVFAGDHVRFLPIGEEEYWARLQSEEMRAFERGRR